VAKTPGFCRSQNLKLNFERMFGPGAGPMTLAKILRLNMERFDSIATRRRVDSSQVRGYSEQPSPSLLHSGGHTIFSMK
jgi:hypothetical protein